MSVELFYSLMFFIFGLLLGSFYNVVGMRVPLKQSISYPSSHCTKCKTPLRWYELVPVFSYLGLGGKCRTCKIRISPMYPMIELLTGTTFLMIYNFFGLSIEAIFYVILSSMLIIITISDIKTMLIPDKILIAFGMILVPLSVIVVNVSILNQVVGLLIAFGINFLILVFTKGNGMGGGDIKLFMLLGFLLGVKMLITIFFLSAMVGLIVGVFVRIKSKTNMFPFGPSIAVATMISVFYGEKIVSFYFNFL